MLEEEIISKYKPEESSIIPRFADKHGFILTESTVIVKDKNLANKWEKIIYNGNVLGTKAQKAIFEGVPLCMKYKLWSRFIREKKLQYKINLQDRGTLNLKISELRGEQNGEYSKNIIQRDQKTHIKMNQYNLNKVLQPLSDSDQDGQGYLLLNEKSEIFQKHKLSAGEVKEDKSKERFDESGVQNSPLGNKESNKVIHKCENQSIDEGIYKNKTSSEVATINPISRTGISTDSKATPSYAYQIHVDIQRTFRNHILFHDEFGAGQCRLFNILFSFSKKYPKVGYCQGMSSFTALILMYFPESEVMEFLEDIFLYNKLYNIFDHELSGIHYIISLQENVFRSLCPKLYNHLVKNQIDLNLFIYSWILTLFTRFQTDLTLRIWDLFIFYDFTALFVVSAALLKDKKDTIFEKSGESLLNFMTNFETLSFNTNKIIKYTKEYMSDINLDIYRNYMDIGFNFK